MESLMKHSKDILLHEPLISIDTWATILYYFRDINGEPTSPNQLIAIMTMSFVNKSLRNLITSNMFWILYNSIEYEPSKYNIYDCNKTICQIIHKIRTFKKLSDVDSYSCYYT